MITKQSKYAAMNQTTYEALVRATEALYEIFNHDYELFPLPIDMDAVEERKEMRKREKRIRSVIAAARKYAFLNQREVAGKIVADLAGWSEKYPRNVIHPTSSQKRMDGELIALEERAKKYLASLADNKTHSK